MTADSDEDLKGKPALEEMGARLGELGAGLKAAFSAIADAVEQVERSGGVHDVTVETPEGPLQAKAGWSVRVGGLAGRGDTFAPEPVEPETPKGPPVRTPQVDVYEDETAWIVAAELPGVAQNELKITPDGERLILETTGARRYRAEVQVPADVDAAGAEARLTNGILEVRAPKQAGSDKP